MPTYHVFVIVGYLSKKLHAHYNVVLNHEPYFDLQDLVYDLQWIKGWMFQVKVAGNSFQHFLGQY